MPSWLKNIVSLGRRPKGSTKVTKQDQSNSRSGFKSNAPSKSSSSNGQKSTPESQPEEKVGERKRTQAHGKLPRNTTKNSEEQPRDSVNMTAAATTATAASPTQKTSTSSVSDHVHFSQRTGDLIQASAHNGDIEISGSTLNPNQIVFVLRSDTGGYRIYSLLEEEPSAAAAAAAAKSSDESASDDGEKIKTAKVINGKASDDHGKTKKPSPFRLSVTSAQSLPEELTREFLVEKLPEHLTGVDELHVIVSTRSGLGLAAGFYEGVLGPLLEDGFGFEAVGDVVEGYDDDKEGRKTKSGKTYQITFTKSADTVKDFARGLVSSSSSSSSAPEEQQQPSRTIILLSGDGGIIDLLNGLDHHQLDASPSPSPTPAPIPTLAILPLGTGNALFHSLHKPLYKPQGTDGPSPLVLGLRTLFKRGISAPLPTFRAEFSPGAKLISGQPEVIPGGDDEPKDNLLFDVTRSSGTPKKRPEITHLLGAIVFSYGFHASLVYESDTPAYRVHGDKRFGMAAGELLKLSHSYDAEVSIRRSCTDGEETLPKESHSTYILLTLVSNLEKTFCISPASGPLDGQLRLVHFGFGEQGVGGGAAGAEAEAENRGKQTMDIMMAAYRDGAHINDPKFKDVVGYEGVEEIRVVINETDERWRKVCVDGTIVEVEKGGWVTVKRERVVRNGTGSGKGGKEKERLKVLVDEGVVVGR